MGPGILFLKGLILPGVRVIQVKNVFRFHGEVDVPCEDDIIMFDIPGPAPGGFTRRGKICFPSGNVI